MELTAVMTGDRTLTRKALESRCGKVDEQVELRWLKCSQRCAMCFQSVSVRLPRLDKVSSFALSSTPA